MKKIIVFRHGPAGGPPSGGRTSWELPLHLTEAGKELMRNVALRYKGLLKECYFFYTGPLIRAQESLYAMMEGLGYDPNNPDIFLEIRSGLWSYNPKGWFKDGPLHTVKQLWEQNPTLVESEARNFVETISRIAQNIFRGDTALCISHAGPLDLGLAWIKKELYGTENSFSEMVELQKGEGVIFTFDDNNHLISVEELRHPRAG